MLELFFLKNSVYISYLFVNSTIKVFLTPVIYFIVEILGERVEVGPVVEEVLRLRRVVILTITEDAVGLLLGDGPIARADEPVAILIPIVVVFLVSEAVVPAIAEPVFTTVSTIRSFEFQTTVDIINTTTYHLTETVGNDILQLDVPGIEPYIDPVVVILVVDLTYCEKPKAECPQGIASLDTEIAQQEGFLTFAATGGGTTDGVDLTVDDVTKHPSMHKYHT